VAVVSDPGRADQGRRLLDEAVRLLDVVQSTRAHGGPDCRWCPLCRASAALREVDPDAVDRVSSAVSDLAVAVRHLIAAPSRPDPRPSPWDVAGEGQGGGVQHIDVTD
jgi:hypothetical protein